MKRPARADPAAVAAPAPRRRRKAARPAEIVEAAIAVFAERGFGAAKLEDVARRAGVSKGTVFVYFPNKEALFRAVAQTVLATHLGQLRAGAADLDQPIDELLPALLMQAAGLGESRLAAILRVIVGESRRFPDLARVWHEEVVSKALGMLTAAIARGQARGGIRAGDPALYAFSILGGMLAGVLFREVFADTQAWRPDLHALAEQHARTVLHGLMA